MEKDPGFAFSYVGQAANLQLDIFTRHQKGAKLEILRIEVRLNKRDKMKQLFKKLNLKSTFTFKSLFKPTISKTILLHYLDELENRRPKLIDYKMVILLRQGFEGQGDKGLLAI